MDFCDPVRGDVGQPAPPQAAARWPSDVERERELEALLASLQSEAVTKQATVTRLQSESRHLLHRLEEV